MLISMLALYYHKTCSIYEFLHHDTYSYLEISHTILYDAFIILYNLEIYTYVSNISYFMPYGKMEDTNQSALP